MSFKYYPPYSPTLTAQFGTAFPKPNNADSFLKRVGSNLTHSLKLHSTEDKVLFWSGFTYVPAAVLSPMMTEWQLKQQGTPVYERNLLVRSEAMRQVIGALAHFAGFFAGLALFGLGRTPGKPKTLQRLAGSMVGATLSYAFVRPLILNTYMARWVDKNQPTPAQKSLPSRALATQPLQLRSSATIGPQLTQFMAARRQWLG